MLKNVKKGEWTANLLQQVNTTVSLDYEIKMIGRESMDDVMNLQHIVYESLENKEIFHPNTLEDNVTILDAGGHILGVFFERQLIAFRIVDIPGLERPNLGRDLNFDEEELKKVAIFDTTVVHPDFRGHGFQKKTLLKSREILLDQNYRHGLATVSPNNLYSVRNLLKAGFVIRQLKKKYGEIDDAIDGKLRYILYMDMQQTSPKKYKHIVHIKNHQVEKQQMFLNNGYEGFEILIYRGIDDFTVAYGKV